MYDSTEKHIVAHGRMSNIVYKFFYHFGLELFGRIVGTAADDHFVCEFNYYPSPNDDSYLQYFRILTLEEIKPCIFSNDPHDLYKMIIDSKGSFGGIQKNTGICVLVKEPSVPYVPTKYEQGENDLF